MWIHRHPTKKKKKTKTEKHTFNLDSNRKSATPKKKRRWTKDVLFFFFRRFGLFVDTRSLTLERVRRKTSHHVSKKKRESSEKVREKKQVIWCIEKNSKISSGKILQQKPVLSETAITRTSTARVDEEKKTKEKEMKRFRFSFRACLRVADLTVTSHVAFSFSFRFFSSLFFCFVVFVRTLC